jgi:type IV pilus assembly protein PilM
MRKSASFRSLRYATDILGVDLGSHTLKVLQLRVRGKHFSVVGFAQKEVWPLLAEAQTEDDKRAAYARALKEVIKTQRFKPRGAALALSGSYSIVRFLSLSKPFKTDARTGLPAQAHEISPFEPDDTTFDVRILDEDASRANAMAVIGQKRAIGNAIAILNKAGLRSSVILNDALALESAYDFLHGAETEQPIVLVNIGAATTTVTIVENRVLKAARTLNIAGDALTRAVKRDFNVSAEEAESLKKEYGLFGHRMAASARQPTGHNEAFRIYNETAVRVFKALDRPIHELIVDIHRTIDAFLDKRGKDAPHMSKIVLSGGGASLKSLQEMLGTETGMPVEVFQPLEQPGGGKPEGAVGADAAVVFGLALTSALRGRESAPRVNLLPPEAKRAAALRNFARVFGIVLLISGALAGGHTLYLLQHKRVAEREAAAELKLRAGKPEAPNKASASKAERPKPKPVSPFAFLGKLRVSGAFGDVVMLNGGGGEYVAKDGRLFDDGGKALPNITTRQTSGTIVLSAPGEQHTVQLPK